MGGLITFAMARCFVACCVGAIICCAGASSVSRKNNKDYTCTTAGVANPELVVKNINFHMISSLKITNVITVNERHKSILSLQQFLELTSEKLTNLCLSILTRFIKIY